MGPKRTRAGLLGLAAMLLVATAPPQHPPPEPEVSAVVLLDPPAPSLQVRVRLRAKTGPTTCASGCPQGCTRPESIACPGDAACCLVRQDQIPEAYLCSLVSKEKGDQAEVCPPVARSVARSRRTRSSAVTPGSHGSWFRRFIVWARSRRTHGSRCDRRRGARKRLPRSTE